MYTADYPAHSMRATEFLVGCKDRHYREFFPNWPPLWDPEFILGRPEQAGGDALDIALFKILHEQLITNLSANGSATTTRYQRERSRSGLVQTLQPILSAPAPQHGLFSSFARAELQPSHLDCVTEVWRRVLMYLAPNHDFVAEFRTNSASNIDTLYDTLLAIQTYSSQAKHFVLSLIQNPHFSFIRLTNSRDPAHAGFNFIVGNTQQPDQHSRAHTLRDLQRQSIIFDRFGFRVSLPETDPRAIIIRSQTRHQRFGEWLKDVARITRAMVQHDIFPNQLEVDSLLSGRPAMTPDFSLDEAAGAIANLGHAMFTDSSLTTQILAALEMSSIFNRDLTHLTEYRHDIQHALRSLLGTSYDHLPASQLDKVISLLATFAHLFPFDPADLYATVPPSNNRDRVVQSSVIGSRFFNPLVQSRTTQLLDRYLSLSAKPALEVLANYHT